MGLCFVTYLSSIFLNWLFNLSMKTYGRCLKPSILAREQNLPEEFENACRLCLTKDNVTTNIYNDDDVVPIPLKLRYCIALEVNEDDGLPNAVCVNCKSQLDQAYTFKKYCLATDVKLRQFIKVPSFSKLISLENNFQETTLLEGSENSTSRDACTLKIEDDCLMYPAALCHSNDTNDKDCAEKSAASDENFLSEDGDVNGVGEKKEPLDAVPLVLINVENSSAVKVENNHDGECSEVMKLDSNEDINLFKENNETKGTILLTKKRKKHLVLSSSSKGKSLNSSEDGIVLAAKKIYRCTHCYCKYFSHRGLQQHIRLLHEETLKICTICEKSFITNSVLERHMRTHTGERPFECRVCNKKFSQKEILNRHHYTHLSEKPLKCQLCKFSCAFSSRMDSHMRSCHSNSDDKVYPKFDCKKCSKSFKHSSGLSRHQAMHTGTVFQCIACEKVFTDKSSVKRHHLKVHPSEAYNT